MELDGMRARGVGESPTIISENVSCNVYIWVNICSAKTTIANFDVAQLPKVVNKSLWIFSVAPMVEVHS